MFFENINTASLTKVTNITNLALRGLSEQDNSGSAPSFPWEDVGYFALGVVALCVCSCIMRACKEECGGGRGFGYGNLSG